MSATFDKEQLFVFTPALDLGLRAGVYDGYGGVRTLDVMRKRAALETWMSHVRHEASGESLVRQVGGKGYLDWFQFDLDDIKWKGQAHWHWQQLRLIVNVNNDVNAKYNEEGISEHLQKFNQFWNSEHKRVDDYAASKPFTEGNKTWPVVHANQQPGLSGLLAAGILVGNKTIYGGHAYQNKQGKGEKLPNRNGYWAHDYDTGKAGRGAARVVLGPTKGNDLTREVWFTDSHYADFVRVIKGHAMVRPAH